MIAEQFVIEFSILIMKTLHLPILWVDMDNDKSDNELNQPNHEGKSAWEKVLDKYAELSSRLDQLEGANHNARSQV